MRRWFNPQVTSEYPGASWIPADPSNYRKGPRALYERIVIHCTDGHAEALPVAEMWQEPYHASSAHFVIGQDGTVIQCVGIRDTAFHAHQANGTSVGVEHCCRTPGELGKTDPGLPPSELLLQAGAKLVAWLCHHANLNPNRLTIMGHAEADKATTHTGCPTSAGIDLNDYVYRVLQVYNF